eukprot:6485632-Amphidinium_carterae.1
MSPSWRVGVSGVVSAVRRHGDRSVLKIDGRLLCMVDTLYIINELTIRSLVLPGFSLSHKTAFAGDGLRANIQWTASSSSQSQCHKQFVRVAAHKCIYIGE